MRVEQQILVGIRAWRRGSFTRAEVLERKAHILFSKPALTMALVVSFAALPLFMPSLARVLSVKGQSYREMLPNPYELISFKSKTSPAGTIGLSNSGSADTSEVIAVNTNSAQLIDDPGRTLERFYTALARKIGRAHV